MLIGEEMSPEQFAQLCAQQKAECEKRSQELLQALPRCTASVVVAGPSYSDKYYFGDVVADSAALLPWAVHHAANSSYRPIPDGHQQIDLDTIQTPLRRGFCLY
jgi:hypothetical protein